MQFCCSHRRKWAHVLWLCHVDPETQRRLFLIWMPAASFWAFAGCYLLHKRCVWCFGDQRQCWILSGTSSLLCGCHCPVKGRVCCLVVGMEAPRCISELKYEVGAIGILPLREEPLSIPLPELFTNKWALLCHVKLQSVVESLYHWEASSILFKKQK